MRKATSLLTDTLCAGLLSIGASASAAPTTSLPTLASLSLQKTPPKGYVARGSLQSKRAPYSDDVICRKLLLGPKGSQVVFAKVLGNDGSSEVFGNETLVRASSAAVAKATYLAYVKAAKACNPYTYAGAKTIVKVTRGPIAGKDASTAVTQVTGSDIAREEIVLHGRYLLTVNGFSETSSNMPVGLTFGQAATLAKAAVKDLGRNR
jgi:hypothetical protein